MTKAGLVSDNSGFGSAGKKQVEELAPKAGIEIVISEVYDKGATDLTDILAKVKAKGVQAVINWSIVPAQSIVPKNMKQLGMEAALFQSHGFGNIKYVEQAGAAAEGILFPAGRLLVADVLPDTHPQKAVLSKYKADYEAAFKEPVSTFGGHAYDALMIVVAAVEKAGGTEPEKVRAAIEGLKGFVGTAGIFNFSAEDHNGLALDAFELITVKDGKFVPAKK
jgi:branched-chain amino acid transport system substrate-binding protein